MREAAAAMSSDVILIVLLGAALHASWNAFVKSSDDKIVDTALITAGAAVLACVCVPFLPLPAAASWPYLAGSVAIHGLYFMLVAAAYRAGEMNFVYPLMRGTAPMIVAALSAVVAGERLGTGAWAGVLLIRGGVLGLAASRRPHSSAGETMALALANALVIALYTFVDGLGARLSGQAFAYTFWMFVFTAPLLLACRRLPACPGCGRSSPPDGAAICWEGRARSAPMRSHLWAMTRAPIAPVAALRETSILFGMAIAALVLKERFGFARCAAAAAIALGAVALRIG